MAADLTTKKTPFNSVVSPTASGITRCDQCRFPFCIVLYRLLSLFATVSLPLLLPSLPLAVSETVSLLISSVPSARPFPETVASAVSFPRQLALQLGVSTQEGIV
jgi:hypothetical protein